MDEVKGRVLAAWCLAEQFGVFGGGRKCLHKLGSALKEVLVGTVQVAKGLLNGHRGDITKPGIVLLQMRHQSGEGVIVELHAKLGISSLAGCESPIVDEAATPEHLREDTLLFVGRIEPILICPLLFAHCLLPFLDTFLDENFQPSIDRWKQDLAAILGTEHNMIVAVIDHIIVTVNNCLHAQSIAEFSRSVKYHLLVLCPCTQAPKKEAACIAKARGFTPRNDKRALFFSVTIIDILVSIGTI